MVFRLGNTLAEPKMRVYAANPNSARILDVWKLATEAERNEGMFWYWDAHAFALTLDPERPERAAGVIAALSPMKSWKDNCILAARAFEQGFASGALGANVYKADAILSGADPLEILGGHKVRNFYKSIINPMDPNAVCIDRHAFDIAVGRITNDQTRAALKRKGLYESFGAAYERACRAIIRDEDEEVTDIVPSQLQAVTWTVWRRLKGIDDLG
jgi:hypothetical protein